MSVISRFCQRVLERRLAVKNVKRDGIQKVEQSTVKEKARETTVVWSTICDSIFTDCKLSPAVKTKLDITVKQIYQEMKQNKEMVKRGEMPEREFITWIEKQHMTLDDIVYPKS